MDRTIVDVTPRTVPASSRVLATAFADDPLLRWIQPRRWTDPVVFAGIYLATHGAPGAGHLLLDDGQPVGAAFWDPPGYEPPQLRQLASLPVLALGVRLGLPRGAATVKLTEKHRPTEPHWYLSTVGAVYPGRGIGSALLRHGLEMVDGPAYLESSNPRNVPLYERYGFVAREPISVPGGPELVPMYRPG